MSVGKAVLNSYAWTVAGQWVSRGLGIASTLVLLRLLSPDDFGIAALAIMVIMFFQALSATGADAYILRLSKVSEEQLYTAWTIQLLSRVVISGLIIGFSSQLAYLANDSRLDAVLIVAGLSPIIEGLQSPRIVLLKKEMRFDLLTKLQVAARLGSVIFTLMLAYHFENYWALVIGSLGLTTLFTIGSYCILPVFPRLSIGNLKAQLGYSQKILLSSILGFLRSKADLLVVNSRFGTGGVGIFNIGQEFALLPLTEIVSPIGMPLYSGLSRISENVELMVEKATKYLSIVYIIVVPSFVGINLLSDQIVNVVLGDKWVDAKIILETLSFLMIVFPTVTVFKTIYELRALFKFVFLIEVLGLGLILAVLLVPYDFSVGAFSLYRAAVGFLVVFVAVLGAKVALGFSPKQLLIAMLLPTLASVVMAAIVVFTKEWFSAYTLVEFLINVLVGVAAYVGTLLGLVVLLKSRHMIWEYNYSLVSYFLLTAGRKIIGHRGV